MELITSVDDERIDVFRSLRNSQMPSGIYIVEGREPLRQVLISKDEVIQLFISEEEQGFFDEFLSSLQFPKPQILIAKKSVMSDIVGFHLHQGFLATVKKPELIRTIPDASLRAVALDGIEKAENVGAIVRTAIGFGVKTILVDPRSCSPYARRAVRVSMGTVSHCDVIECDSLAEELRLLRERSAEILRIAVELDERACPYRDVLIPESFICVFGGEGKGISKEVLSACDSIVSIPMDTEYLNSLNVVVACGIVLAEFAGKK